MTDAFDPYHKWLGIPPAEQPAHDYRLLGLALFEDGPTVIDSAADQRMAHLRTFQQGKHSAECQKLLNEVSSARVRLLDPKKKAAYDAVLRRRLEEEGLMARAIDLEDEPEPAPLGPVVDTHVPRERVRRKRSNVASMLGAGVAAVGSVVLLGLLIAWMTGGPEPSDPVVAVGDPAGPSDPAVPPDPAASSNPAAAMPAPETPAATSPVPPPAEPATGGVQSSHSDAGGEDLDYLAESDDAETKALAKREIESPPATPLDQMALADAWWDLAEGSGDAAAREAMQRRAGAWYRQALPAASTTLERIKAHKRLQQLAASGVRLPGEVPAAAQTGSSGPPDPSPETGAPAVSDEHYGVAGAPTLTRGNTYTLEFPEPTALAAGCLRFKGIPEGGHFSNGTITASVDGGSWQPIGNWTQESCEEAAANGDWHTVSLDGLPEGLEATSLAVKFEFQLGYNAMIIHRVEWVSKQPAVQRPEPEAASPGPS
jgi:hypothetical protein